MNAQIQRLFVYGTLAPGRANHKILENIPGDWQKASLKGTLLEQGWGAAMGYPGIIPDEAGEVVEGFLFSSTQLTDHWQMLDDFEGEGYERVLVNVTTNKIDQVQAFVYALKNGS